MPGLPRHLKSPIRSRINPDSHRDGMTGKTHVVPTGRSSTFLVEDINQFCHLSLLRDETLITTYGQGNNYRLAREGVSRRSGDGVVISRPAFEGSHQTVHSRFHITNAKIPERVSIYPHQFV